MGAALDLFCSRTRQILQSDGTLRGRLDNIAAGLAELVADPVFVAETFTEETPPGKRVLHHDATTDFYVLAHVQQAGKGGSPHSHGASWAIYGNARGFTEMTEWRRVNPESEDHAELVSTEKYRLGPGDTRAYEPGMIHSTAHPEKAWVVRVTGTDLDTIPRYHFSARRDKILAEVG